MCHFYNVTLHFCKNIFFIIFKSLRSSVSEGILAVEERMSKQEDIRKKKVCCGVYSQTLAQSNTFSALRGMWFLSGYSAERSTMTLVSLYLGIPLPVCE